MTKTKAGGTPAIRDKRARRGAALIIAIAIMTVLLAIGLTFFTVARVESTTAANVVNTVRAEHLVDAGFAIAEYQLNRDLQVHPQATSLDHAWRSLFNGAAYIGKNWAKTADTPGSYAFNIEPIEHQLRLAGVIARSSLLYVKFPKDGYVEPLFRGPQTAPWLAIPRWQGNDILLYKSDNEMPLCYVDTTVVPPVFTQISDAAVNLAIAPFRIVRFDNSPAANAQYPFVTADFFGPVIPLDPAGNPQYPFGTTGLWPAEQIDTWADIDTNNDGMRDSIWIPLPKDADLSADGVDNDLDGTADRLRTVVPGDPNQISVDEDGNPRRDFEIGAFVYRASTSGRAIRTLDDPDVPASHLELTIPLPGLSMPVDMNNDGKIDGLDYYNNTGKPDPGGTPVYVTLPGTVNVPTLNGPVALTIDNVDSIDNDYDQFVNGFSAYVFLGDPNSLGRLATAADTNAQTNAGAPAADVHDATNARTRFANKIINWPLVMPGISFSSNAPAWLTAPVIGLPPVVITLTGEPVCDVVGRAAIHVVDESSKVNMNAAGGHIYRDDDASGAHIQRAFNEGASTYEYETRALPDIGVDRASNFWGMLTGAGWMLDPPTGSLWDYSPLPVKLATPPAIQAPLRPYAYDISLPGYGRVDDNVNSLLFAFNGRADAGNQYPDEGLWLPPVSPITKNVLAGITPVTALNAGQSTQFTYEMTGYRPGEAAYAEVAKTAIRPMFTQFFNHLGMLEGIDEPAELQSAAPMRNSLAEHDAVPNTVVGDNNNDGVPNEIGEAGDRTLANHYALQKAAEGGSQMLGTVRWAALKNVVTANSDSRNVNYVDSAIGLRAINKVDPNLAPPAQLAAGLIIKGGLTPVTTHPMEPGRISLPQVDPENRLPFAEGLRQADTKFTGYLFDQNDGVFAADPVLQALQVAVNIADSRDADSARSLLVTDKRVTAAYGTTSLAAAMARFYLVPVGSVLNPPAELPNFRERVASGDAFPIGELQDFLINALGGAAAGNRVVSVDQWWQTLTDAVDTTVTTDREDRPISYAAAGVDAVRINELMVRPVRRVEAEARSAAAAVPPYANLNPAPYPGMPEFNLQTDTVFPVAGTAWKLRSAYDTAPPGGTAPANPFVLGDETAYVYTVPSGGNTPNWTQSGDDPTRDINDDIIEFRVKATPDGLPAGRYYLTVNVMDQYGFMTVDNIDQLEYSVKYYNSDPTVVGPPDNLTISQDIRFIENLQTPTPTEVSEQARLLADYFKTFWQTADEPEFIATGIRRDNGSGAPEGWVFAPTRPLSTRLNASDYANLANVNGSISAFQDLFDIPRPPTPPYSPDSPYRWSQAYFRDGVLKPAVGALYGADNPAPGVTTLTVDIPDPAISAYDTLCIGFRLKPKAGNLVDANGNPRRLSINFLDFSQQPDHEYVELANTTDKAVDLTGWTLEVGIPDPEGYEDDPTMRDPFKSRWTLEKDSVTGAPPVIAPKGYLLLGFDKYDQFQTGLATNLVQANGMGLTAGTAGSTLLAAPQLLDYVTVPPIAGATTDAALYSILSDATASVFRRSAPSPASITAGTVDTDYADYIDNDGDGVSSSPLVYNSGSGGVPVTQNLDRDTDGVAVEAKYHGNDEGVVPPFARIVQLTCKGLWWQSASAIPSLPRPETSPYAADAVSVGWAELTNTKRIAELVLRGGILPDYPEHDGHDNDGDGGYTTVDKTGAMAGASGVGPGLTGLLRYERGTLDKDMVDNNLDGRIDECGAEQWVQNPVNQGAFMMQSGNPLRSEGVDEGRLGLVPFVVIQRPRTYGFGSFEEGDMPLWYTPCVGNDDPGKGLRWGYKFWVGELSRQNLYTYQYNALPLTPEQGFPYGIAAFAGGGIQGLGFPTNYTFWPLAPGALGMYSALNPVVSPSSSPEWKAFCERRWNPGDNVIVTLYVGPASERKVADRVTYRELDVTNRAVDDIAPSPYAVDGYRDFVYDISTGTPYARWAGADGDPVAAVVCLDRNRQQYWLPNQMGLDFYRSLERKHPLDPGDRFGASNRWEATDGSYDDWADSLSPFEAMGLRSPSISAIAVPPVRRFSLQVPGDTRLFGHAIWGSPLRMNTQQRLWDNPPDLVALLVAVAGGLPDPEGLSVAVGSMVPTIPLDAPAGATVGKRRQFVESDTVETLDITTNLSNKALFEDRAYSLRRAEVRNRPFNSTADLMKLPMLGFNVPLNPGTTDPVNGTIWHNTNAALNTRWSPNKTDPPYTGLPPYYWRQDTTLQASVLATATDTTPSGPGFAGVADLADINPITLTVGQARFRPILATPSEAADPTLAPPYLNWSVTGTTVTKMPHGWAPVMLLAGGPLGLHYPPPLPVGNVVANKPVAWDPPAAWPQWALFGAPYLMQTDFLRDPNHAWPIFGALLVTDVEDRWPRERLFPAAPPPPALAPPLEEVEYPRAVMYVSQYDESLGEGSRAEGVFSWDRNAGLENGTYVAYVATFVPRMGKSLTEADNQVIERLKSSVTAGGVSEYGNTIVPQQEPLPPGTLNAVQMEANRDAMVARICALDPAMPHAENDDRFDPWLALEFITDPAVADRVAPPRSAYTPPSSATPLAAMPNPADWYPAIPLNGTETAQTAPKYHADGDGTILYSGSGQVTTWRARMVRVTDHFLALRVRNAGTANQVACITAVILAPARHVAGKIDVNTVENERVIGGQASAGPNFSLGVFNTLLGLPGVVDALSTVRDPVTPDNYTFIGKRPVAETDFGWPSFGVPKAGVADPLRLPWPSPVNLVGLDMPPLNPRAGTVLDNNLLGPVNGANGWVGAADGVGAMRLSSMIMGGRTFHFDGRYYESFGDLAAGAGTGGTIQGKRRFYPLSNENAPEGRFDEIDTRFGRMANLITTRSDVFEILVTVQAGSNSDNNGDNRIDYRGVGEFVVTAESQGRAIYERRARNDRSDEAAQ